MSLDLCDEVSHVECVQFGEDRGLMRTRLVREWLEQTVESASQATIMSRSAVDKLLAGLRDFDEAFNLARMLTYSEPAAEYQHVYMILVIIFCFTCPFAMVENLSYMVVIPALVICFLCCHHLNDAHADNLVCILWA